MAADPVRDTMTRLPPLPERVAAEPHSTDARQQFTRTPHGELKIAGTSAADVEGAGAELALTFDDRRVEIALRPNQTAEQSALLLARVVPAGYRLSIGARRGEEVTCELIREPQRAEAAAKDAPLPLPRTSTPLSTAVAQPLAAR